jgi:hypothetical protein
MPDESMDLLVHSSLSYIWFFVMLLVVTALSE